MFTLHSFKHYGSIANGTSPYPLRKGDSLLLVILNEVKASAIPLLRGARGV